MTMRLFRSLWLGFSAGVILAGALEAARCQGFQWGEIERLKNESGGDLPWAYGEAVKSGPLGVSAFTGTYYDAFGVGEFTAPVPKPVIMPAGVGSFSTASSVPVVRVNASSFLDSQQMKGSLRKMGGYDVRLTGQFTRDKKKAYIVMWCKSWKKPLFFNLKSVSDKSVTLVFRDLQGGNKETRYKISVYRPWFSGKMDSIIKFTLKRGEGKSFQMTLREIFGVTYNAGLNVVVGEHSYRLFYVSEVKEVKGKTAGEPDPDKKMVVFLFKKGKDYLAYLMPSEEIPGDTPRFYNLYGKDKAGLRMSEGMLEVYDGGRK